MQHSLGLPQESPFFNTPPHTPQPHTGKSGGWIWTSLPTVSDVCRSFLRNLPLQSKDLQHWLRCGLPPRPSSLSPNRLGQKTPALLLPPLLPPEGAYLEPFTRPRRSLAMNYRKQPALAFHVGKGNFSPQRRQERTAPQDKHRDSSGAKRTCQRQLLLVNKHRAKDKASPPVHPLEFLRDGWIFGSACLPGRRGLQECLHLCNFSP